MNESYSAGPRASTPNGHRPPKPPSAHVDDQAADAIPPELKALPRWVVWRWDWRKGKWTKPPIDPHAGKPTDATDETAWMTFDEARKLSRKLGDGIGFALGKDGPYTGIDLDKVISDDGLVDPWAQAIVARFASFTEVTPSLSGMRVWVRGHLPRDAEGETRHRTAKHPHIEFYDADRYFTVTGASVGPVGTIEDRQAELNALHAEIFTAEKPKREPKGPKPSIFVVTATNDDLADDDDLIRKALSAKNGPKFAALFDRGDTSDYAGDASAADFALCSLIGFWTGDDPARVERIFDRSALGQRDKWRGRADYRSMTIRKALDALRETYTPPTSAQPSTNGNNHPPKGGAARGKPSPPAVFSNFAGTVKGTKSVRSPHRMEQLAGLLDGIAPGWPKRVDERLFLEGADHTPVYLDSPARVFAWVDRLAHVVWTKGAGYVTQERFYEHLRMTVERYDAIETMPHWPRMPGTFYMHREIPPASGKLDELLDYFHPASPVDRELIRAFVLTLFWGGQPGSRPAFLITGPDKDPGLGRGIGKTRLVDILADELAGGFFDITTNDDMADVKKRMLSGSKTLKRVCRLDNVKTLRFSWSDLEGMITTSLISGQALYQGEGSRPNSIVWAITLNGASLSKDMAQRVIPVQLDRPKFRANWEEEVRAFIREHRWAIIAEVGEILSADGPTLDVTTRWGAWERSVLSRVLAPVACRDVIVSRQGAIDEDNAEQDLVAEYFADELRVRKLDPDAAVVKIPSSVAAEWLSKATRKPYATNAASSYIKGLSIKQLTFTRTNSARYWVWRGEKAPAGAKLEDLPPVPFGVFRP